MWEIREVLNMKVREFRVQVWDRMGSRIHDSVTRDRVLMLQDLDRQTQRSDMDLSKITVEIRIVDINKPTVGA
jgi:hypothetical protein